MTEEVLHSASIRRFRPSFHLGMSLLMALFVFGGFGMTYLGPMAAGTMPPTPPVVHLHGAFFFSWMLLLVLQSALVGAGNVRLHRSVGTFGIAMGGVIAFLAALIAILGASTPATTADDYGLQYLSMVAPPSFAVLFAMAIGAVRTPAIHRNLMLLAMVSILMPGINRLYMMGLGLKFVPFLATYLTMDAMVAAVFYQEHRATGRISLKTLVAAAIIIVPQLLLPVVAPPRSSRTSSASSEGWSTTASRQLSRRAKAAACAATPARTTPSGTWTHSRLAPFMVRAPRAAWARRPAASTSSIRPKRSPFGARRKAPRATRLAASAEAVSRPAVAAWAGRAQARPDSIAPAKAASATIAASSR